MNTVVTRGQVTEKRTIPGEPISQKKTWNLDEVRGPIRSESGSRLEIEMQSGDTLILEAQEFEFGTW